MRHEAIRDIIAIPKRPHEVIQGIYHEACNLGAIQSLSQESDAPRG